MLTKEVQENLRQTYHWVTSLSEESLTWLAALRLETRSPAGDAALANAVWAQLAAYSDRYKATFGIEHAEFLFQYAQSLHRNPRWLLDTTPNRE